MFMKFLSLSAWKRYISKQECAQYEESVKYYRDIKNVVDTSHEEGREEETNSSD